MPRIRGLRARGICGIGNPASREGGDGSMSKTLRTISLPLVIGGPSTLPMAPGGAKEQTVDPWACPACAPTPSRVDAAASRAEAAASRAEAAAQRAEAASQKAEAMFGKSVRK